MRRPALLLFALATAACSPIEPPVVDASALASTTNSTGPYEVTARVQARRKIDSVVLVWRNLPASVTDAQRVPMAQDSGPGSSGASGVYRANIPGQGVGAQIAFHVEATDSSGDTAADPLAGSPAQCGDEYCFGVVAP